MQVTYPRTKTTANSTCLAPYSKVAQSVILLACIRRCPVETLSDADYTLRRFVAILSPSREVLECYLEWRPPTGQFIIYYGTLTILPITMPTDTLLLNETEKKSLKNDTIKFISWLIWNDPLSPVLRKRLDHMRMIVILYANIKVHTRTVLSKN